VASGPEEQTCGALARLEIIADTYLSLSSPVQWAFPNLLAQRKTLKPQLRDRVNENWAWLKTAVTGNPSYELLHIEGGWYAVLRILNGASDEDLAIALMQNEGVVVHPGHFYDFFSGEFLVVSLIAPVNDFRNGMAAVVSHRR
jgi:alanine-synthesizing transaminase